MGFLFLVNGKFILFEVEELFDLDLNLFGGLDFFFGWFVDLR